VVAFQRASMVAIGIVLVLVADSLLWPTRAEPKLRRSLAARARELGAALRAAPAAPSAPAEQGPAASATGPPPLVGQLALLDAARSELGVGRATVDALARVALLLEAIGSRARMLSEPARRGGPAVQDGRFVAASSELVRQVEIALDSGAAALVAGTTPAPSADDLDRALRLVEAERDRLFAASGWDEALEGRVADLRDLTSLLHSLERTLAAPAPAEGVPGGATRLRPRLDPFRTKVALRTGIAVTSVIVLVMALGWPMNTVVAPIAFLVASMTRGASRQAVPAMGVLIVLGWVLADASIVYLTPELQRMPLALVIPFALASALGYLAAVRPRLAMAPLMVGLVAMLPVFGGRGPVVDVFGSYSIVCYMALALGVGWLFGELLWPATSAGLFRLRVAMQLEKCLETVESVGESGDAARSRRVADLIRACARQTAQIGPLHAQARREPVERALDERRRGEVLARTADLIDAVVGHRPLPPDPLARLAHPSRQDLSAALTREEEALGHSIRNAVAVLRGEAPYRESGLAAAHENVRSLMEVLRAQPEPLPAPSDEQRRGALVHLDSRRSLVRAQCAIEDWLAEWQRAEKAQERASVREEE
jgi:hypothetical protein